MTYADSARHLRQLGYYPLPLPPGEKKHPPVGWTGREGNIPSGADVETWIESHADGNVALRMPKGVIGIDVDDYDGKDGAATMVKAIEAFGAPPRSGRMTSRDDGISGIRLYRLPEYLELVNDMKAAGIGPGVEILQFHHRYCVGPGSIHPDTDAAYVWYNPDGSPGELPAVEDLPELPKAWIDGLLPRVIETPDDVEHDAYDEMEDAQRARVDAYVAAGVAGVRADLEAAQAWPVGYSNDAGWGWEMVTWQGAARLVALAKADWTAYTYADAKRDLAETAPRDGSWTLNDIGGKFAHAMADEEPASFPAKLGATEDWLDHALARTAAARGPLEAGDDVEPLPAWPKHEQNDLGNSQRLELTAGGDLYRIPERDKWARWNGKTWIVDAEAAYRFAMDAMGQTFVREHAHYDDIPLLDNQGRPKPGSSERAKFGQWCEKQKMNRHYRDAVSVLAGSGRRDVPWENFDKDDLLLNVGNGVVDLRTGQLQQHDPLLFMTRIANSVDYVPGARAPIFERFLARAMPDPGMAEYLQKIVGYSLTGSTREQLMFIHHGKTQNGKSVLSDVLQRILGDFAAAMPEKVLIETRTDEHPAQLIALEGSRFLHVSETPRGARLDDALIKRLTGGDAITARGMRENFRTFEMKGKLHMFTNHTPHIVAHESTARRLRVVPWVAVIPDSEKDPDLLVKLMSEAEGILAWAVEGARKWWSDGHLAMPIVAQMATDAFLEREDELGDWITDTLEPDEKAWTQSTLIWRAYEAWCSNRGIKAMNHGALSQQLEDRGILKSRRSSGQGFKVNLKTAAAVNPGFFQ